MFRGELSISTFEVKVKDENDGIKEIKGKRLEVRILGHEVAEKSFGGLKNVVTYQLSWQFWKDENDTSPLTGAVLRRYSDFDWLRDILRLRYRGMLIPPLPEKKMLGGSDDFLDFRMGELQFFLNEIVANPFLMCDHALALFLRHGAEVSVLSIYLSTSLSVTFTRSIIFPSNPLSILLLRLRLGENQTPRQNRSGAKSRQVFKPTSEMPT